MGTGHVYNNWVRSKIAFMLDWPTQLTVWLPIHSSVRETHRYAYCTNSPASLPALKIPQHWTSPEGRWMQRDQDLHQSLVKMEISENCLEKKAMDIYKLSQWHQGYKKVGKGQGKEGILRVGDWQFAGKRSCCMG